MASFFHFESVIHLDSGRWNSPISPIFTAVWFCESTHIYLCIFLSNIKIMCNCFCFNENTNMTLCIRKYGAVIKNPPANAGDARNVGLTPRSGRSPGVGNGNPFQYSCLGIPMDKGAWQAIIHVLTWLSTHTHTHTHIYINIRCWLVTKSCPTLCDPHGL